MTNQPENTATQLNKMNKIFKLTIFLLIGVVILSVGFILFQSYRNKSYEKNYKKEMKNLSSQLDSLRKNRTKLDADAVSINNEIEQLKSEKEQIYYRISLYQNQLSTLKKQYETISNYAGIPDDTLHRIFTARFDH